MSGRSGSQNEFGRAVPVRLPGRRWCPRGHQLAIGGCTGGWLHLYDCRIVTCKSCQEFDPAGASWAEPEPSKQISPDQAKLMGLELIATPPDRRGGIGTIALHLDGTPLGDVGVALCGPCRVGVIEHVRVDDSPHRRKGYGRLLVAAALVRGPGYRWSTTPLEGTRVARSFWAAVAPQSLHLGEPQPCSDMADPADPSHLSQQPLTL